MSLLTPQLQMSRIEDILESCIPEQQRADLMRVMYGCDLERNGLLKLSTETHQLAAKLDVDLRAYRLLGSTEQLRGPRLVRVAAIQHQMPLKSTETCGVATCCCS